MYLKVVLEQINNRLNHIETHIVKIYEKFDAVYKKFDIVHDKFDIFKKEIYDKFDELRREMYRQFKWLIFIILSVLFSMWITIILAIMKFK